MSRVDSADAPYWDGLAAGQLMLPRCVGCDKWMWPAGRRCGACGTVGIDWVERPMRAKVFAWTRTWHRFGGTEAFDLPFTSIVAEIENCGIRLLGRLHDPDQVDPRIGQPIVGEPGYTPSGDDAIPTILWSRSE